MQNLSFLTCLAQHTRSSWRAVGWTKPCDSCTASHVIVCSQHHTTWMLRILQSIFSIMNQLIPVPHPIISPTPIHLLPFWKKPYHLHFASTVVSGATGL